MKGKTSCLTLSINFGGLAPTVREQLKSQGLTAPAFQTRSWQKMSQAVGLLYVQGVLAEREAKAARRRIFKDIERAAVRMSKA